MLSELASALMQELSLSLKPDSLCWLANDHASNGKHDDLQVQYRGVSSGGGPVVGTLRFKHVCVLLCLGVGLDRHGTTSASVDDRLAAALKHWHARPELRNRSIASAKRIRRLYMTVIRTLLRGAGGWQLTQTLAGRQLSFESRCLRTMLGRRRGE